MFSRGFEKTANVMAGAKKFLGNSKAMDYAGLGLLAAPTAYEVAGGKTDKGAGKTLKHVSELGGLGLLARSVAKAKH